MTPEALLIGAASGLSYALLGVGLVLVYRATRIINFAYGEMGAFGAAILAKLVIDLHWNWFLALAVVVVVGGLVGGLVEVSVVRRLSRAPRLILLVATIGVAQILFVGQLLLPGVDTFARYPTGLDRAIEVGAFLFRGEHFMALAFVPAIIVGLTLFLDRTPYGVVIRAGAENPQAAELSGVSTKRISTVVWIFAGAIATVTAVLVNPLRGVVVGLPTIALGPSLLLRALVAGLAGGLRSLPWTLAGGVLIGMVEAVLFVEFGDPGVADAVLFVAVLGLVFLRSRFVQREDASAWSLTPKLRPIPERLKSIWWVRNLPMLVGATAAVVAALLPFALSSSAQIFRMTLVVIFALIGLSVTVLTGWAGQLSLGQFALVGVGAVLTVALTSVGMPFAVAVAYATAAGMMVAIAIGAPALRIPGLLLAVTTLAFAVAARSWFFKLDLFTGGETIYTLSVGELGFLDLGSPRTYYYVCLTILAFVAVGLSRLRRSGIGRTVVAVRDNAIGAASFTVSPTHAKLVAFGLAGGLASLAGGLLAAARVRFTADIFGAEESLMVVAMTIIGGLGSVTGAILGAVYVIGVPGLFNDAPEAQLLASGMGLLILLMYFPGGLLRIFHSARDALFGWAEQRLATAPARAEPTVPPPRVSSVSPEMLPMRSSDGTALSADRVKVRFGGVLAIDGVSVHARPGELVGLIGANGAGKSTLMNVISGFQPADGGRVQLFGRDITPLSPESRARAGLGRVFQDARLFEGLTVSETVRVALEARERSEILPSLLGLPPAVSAERQKSAEAADLVDFLGLGRWRDAFLSDLSTGTRRITELACLLALRPTVLLLDEPTAGVAQREAEAFGPLIKAVQGELGATLMLIEHDMPLVMSLSDRMYCLAAGSVIAEGSPDEVRSDPEVVAAYLGTDERAILRSDSMSSGSGRPEGGAAQSSEANGEGGRRSSTRRRASARKSR